MRAKFYWPIDFQRITMNKKLYTHEIHQPNLIYIRVVLIFLDFL